MLHSQSDELRDGEAPEKKKKRPIVQYFILFDFIITVFFFPREMVPFTV